VEWNPPDGKARVKVNYYVVRWTADEKFLSRDQLDAKPGHNQHEAIVLQPNACRAQDPAGLDDYWIHPDCRLNYTIHWGDPLHRISTYRGLIIHVASVYDGETEQKSLPTDRWLTAHECREESEYLAIMNITGKGVTKDVLVKQDISVLMTKDNISQVLPLEKWSCKRCPIGADCSGPTVWSDVIPKWSWWRVPWAVLPNETFF
jgi:hypothetical protein